MSNDPSTHRMTGLRTEGLYWCLAILISFIATAAQAQSLVGAQSRKVHAPGNVDYDLAIDINQPISGQVSLEPRPIGSGSKDTCPEMG